MQKDPLGYFDDTSLYRYCNNNPTNWLDPQGWCKEKKKSWWEWWLYESVVPGPYGQPMSEWGPEGPTTWGDPMKYTEEAGGAWMWTERIAVGTAAAIAAGILIKAGVVATGSKLVVKRIISIGATKAGGKVVTIGGGLLRYVGKHLPKIGEVIHSRQIEILWKRWVWRF